MSDIFREFARDAFGFIAPEVPESVPLRILGLPVGSVPSRDVIMSAFRRRVVESHPDVQFAYDHQVLQDGAQAALSEKPEIRELVWARDVLMERAAVVTANTGSSMEPRLPVTVYPKCKKCWKCGRELGERECYEYGHGRRGRWCYRCCREDDSARARERRRQRRQNRCCQGPGCSVVFTPQRSDGRFCSGRCRQAAHRVSTSGVTPKKCAAAEHLVSVTGADERPAA